MMIDCDACAVRGPACGDCVVTVLLGSIPVRRPGEDGWPVAPEVVGAPIDLDGQEQEAIAVLAGSGLIPPLRLVPATPECAYEPDESGRTGSRAPADQNFAGNRPGDDHRTAV